MHDPRGVRYPTTEGAARGTTETGKRILDAALGAVRTDAAEAARVALAGERQWRHAYQSHFEAVACTMAGDGTLAMARAGLAEAAKSFEFCGADGSVVKIRDIVAPDAAAPPASATIHTAIVEGSQHGFAPTIIDVPFSGRLHGGRELCHLVKTWVDAGQAHASFAASIAEAVAHPEWFDLRGKVFVLIGATSEMGPLEPLLACGATVVALARGNSRSKPEKWQRVIAKARASPGRLVVPLSAPRDASVGDDASGDDALAALAGADATAQTDAIIQWLAGDEIAAFLGAGDALHIYSGIYLPGKHFVRATVAMDAIVAGCVFLSICFVSVVLFRLL